MKKVFYLLSFIGLFLVFNVNAANPLKVTCPNVITYGSSDNCTVTLNLDTEAESYYAEASKTGNIKEVGFDDDYVSLTTGNNTLGKVKITPSAKSGTATVTVTVTVDNTKEYTITSNSIAIVNSVNTLDSISINDKKITIANKNLTTYNAETTAKTAKIEAVATDSSATISGTGDKNLACGDNKITLTVKATNGSSKNYTITVKRKCEENVLKGITLSSGALNPEFKKDIKDYKVTVSKDVDKVTIKGVKNFDAQKITGEVENASLVFGTNNFTLTATDEEGKEVKYNIAITRDQNLTANTLLSSLSLSSGKINFDPNIFEYKTRVLYEVDKVNVLAAAQDKEAKITATGQDKLEVGENKIIVKVTTKNNESKEYVILVNRLKQGETIGDNPNIKNITVEGYNLLFDYNKTDYKLVIKDEKELKITVEMEDEFATYQIAGNHDLKNKSIIQIVTKSADEETSKTYNIEIVKPHSTKIFFIIGAIVLLLLAGAIILAYYLINKKKKDKTDPSNFKIDDETADIITTNKILENNTSIDQEIINDHAGVKTKEIHYNCPLCGKELLTLTENCPNCGKKLI